MTRCFSDLLVQWVKDLALSLQQLCLLLWCGFDPWPGNFYMQQVLHKETKTNTKPIHYTDSILKQLCDLSSKNRDLILFVQIVPDRKHSVSV